MEQNCKRIGGEAKRINETSSLSLERRVFCESCGDRVEETHFSRFRSERDRLEMISIRSPWQTPEAVKGSWRASWEGRTIRRLSRGRDANPQEERDWKAPRPRIPAVSHLKGLRAQHHSLLDGQSELFRWDDARVCCGLCDIPSLKKSKQWRVRVSKCARDDWPDLFGGTKLHYPKQLFGVIEAWVNDVSPHTLYSEELWARTWVWAAQEVLIRLMGFWNSENDGAVSWTR